MLTSDQVRSVKNALESAQAEIEAFEEDVSWYTPSGKLMDRIEAAIKLLAGVLPSKQRSGK